MTTSRPICLALTLLLGLAAAAPAVFAGVPAAQGDTRPNRNLSAVAALELANALDKFALVQAQRALQLDDAQNERFVPRLRALQQIRRRNQQARHRIVQDLRRLAGPRAGDTADESAVRERLVALRANDERAAAELREAHDAIDEVLDPRQQARFRLFEENIETRKLELLMRARARAGRGGP